jgi:hypothetical protein
MFTRSTAPATLDDARAELEQARRVRDHIAGMVAAGRFGAAALHSADYRLHHCVEAVRRLEDEVAAP